MIAGKHINGAREGLQNVECPTGKVQINGMIVEEVACEDNEIHLPIFRCLADLFQRLKAGFTNAIGDVFREARDTQSEVQVSSV